MAHKRVVASTELLRGDSLTRAMVGIGMLFATEPNSEVNIEDTLLAASAEGMEHDDLRVLAVLVTWIKIHHTWINADRLTRAVSKTQSSRIRAFWTAIASWLQKDRRFTRMQRAYDGPRVDVLRNGTAFQIKRKGEDPRFEGTCIRAPARVLRDRATDSIEKQTFRFQASRTRKRPACRCLSELWKHAQGKEPHSISSCERRRNWN